MKKNFYITTAIDYANGKPHLGHAYEKVLADTIARYQKLRGNRVFFLTGLDEHGQKVQQSAQRLGTTPEALCDEVAQSFKDLCRRLNITHDDYIRTTETRHKQVVRTLLQDLYERGDIYKADYRGFYSTRAEQFLQEKDKVNGTWPEVFGEVIEITESNYFFRLGQYQEALIEHINKHENFIFPKYRTKQVLEFLKEPLNDLCISRPKARLAWGISLPFDENFVTYVWFDALINYISAIGYGTHAFKEYWPANYHVIGKDILLPAHAIYWPCMLMAMGIELPKGFLVHGWWLLSGEKMSKSTGTMVDPLEVIERFGADPFRYFLMREMNVGKDSNFSLELFLSRYNDELGNDLGNLVSRLLNMTNRYCNSQVPVASVDEAPEQELKAIWEKTREGLFELFDGFQFHTALESIFAFIRAINRYAEIRSPWRLAKSDDLQDKAKLETALALIAEGIRLSATVLTPVMPSVALQVHNLLSLELPQAWDTCLLWSSVLEGASLGDKTILFPRVELVVPTT